MTRIVDPGTHEKFLAGLRESIETAEDLGSPFLVVTAGDELPGVPRADHRDAVIAVLQRAAQMLEGHPVTLLLENLNSRVDHIGTFCDSTADVISILRQVNSPRVRLLYDAYHSLVMEENPRQVLEGNIDLLGHIQIADAPGRHEPGSGAQDWEADQRFRPHGLPRPDRSWIPAHRHHRGLFDRHQKDCRRTVILPSTLASSYVVTQCFEETLR